MRATSDYLILLKLAEHYPIPIILVDEQLGRVILVNSLLRDLWDIQADSEITLKNFFGHLNKNADSNSKGTVLSDIAGSTVCSNDGSEFLIAREAIHEGYPEVFLYSFKQKAKNENSESYSFDGKNQLNTMLNALPLPIFFKEPSGRYTICNDAFSKFFGLKKNKIIGANIFDLLPRHLAIRYDSMDKQLIETPGEQIKEGCLKTGDGKYHDIIVHKATYSDLSGNTAGIVGVIHDITKQKNIQHMLRKSEKELAELNATKDKFFSILAHDLKNPFSVILGITNFLVENYDDFSDAEIIESLMRLNSSSRHLFNLFENLLEWSRIQRKAVSFNPVKLNLKSTSKLSLQPLLMNATEKKVKIINNIPETIEVISDEKMLETIFRNLISNAIKYSNKNSKVEIEASVIVTGYAEVIITDDGLGMDVETHENLFKIDNIISKPGTEKEKGTGLGLILCHEFITQNGGEIRVESRINEGSKFIFTIPVVNDTE